MFEKRSHDPRAIVSYTGNCNKATGFGMARVFLHKIGKTWGIPEDSTWFVDCILAQYKTVL